MIIIAIELLLFLVMILILQRKIDRLERTTRNVDLGNYGFQVSTNEELNRLQKDLHQTKQHTIWTWMNTRGLREVVMRMKSKKSAMKKVMAVKKTSKKSKVGKK
jgi:hypothetical protein